MTSGAAVRQINTRDVALPASDTWPSAPGGPVSSTAGVTAAHTTASTMSGRAAPRTTAFPAAVPHTTSPSASAPHSALASVVSIAAYNATASVPYANCRPRRVSAYTPTT